ncbi:LacI family DNA-binding transcriptional regulator [Branchiibius sp. NY16-3462-2]|uniref:LacI family DNA-binding transcriptional regulator n=1 Tax=Branchiibius sp. NY16-3462-2 TaxID=1807500 RepID=UPI00079C8C7A|nr:LacI family DNA-binding transcriptional regulator [Branchiibius sp. NY16-3462-2]KYH43217.1 LacI family transcriptional regulator [Branchiibius sp. NY16-3462-2]
MPTTIKDVAARADVSVATVSRVLNGVASVDPAMARRVRAAAKALGYEGNPVARSLRTQKSDLLALIISDIGNPFFTAVARGVEDVAQTAGYSVLLCNSDEDSQKESRYLDIARRSMVAGVLLSPNAGGSDVSALLNANIPVVAIDRALNDAIDSVFVDSSEGARSATEHLLEQGWRRPACITGPREADTAERRARGFREAMTRAGDRHPDSLIRYADYRVAGGRAAAADLLDTSTPPDALFVANSEMVIGAIEEIRSRGMRIGHDIGLVGFDDTPWAPFVEPPLTVIDQPAYNIGAEATRLLLQRVNRSPHNSTTRTSDIARMVLLRTSLTVRESSLRHP